jgi:hypothetical protein
MARPASGIVKTNVSGSFTLSDGTSPAAVTLVASFDRGDFALSGFKQILNEDVAVERRGKFVSVAHGNRMYPSVTFSFWVDGFASSGSAPGTEIEFLMKDGAYASNASTLGTGADVPYAIDIIYTLEGTDFGDSADHTFTLSDVQITDVSYTEAAEGNSVTVTGTVRGAITGDIAAAQIA